MSTDALGVSKYRKWGPSHICFLRKRERRRQIRISFLDPLPQVGSTARRGGERDDCDLPSVQSGGLFNYIFKEQNAELEDPAHNKGCLLGAKGPKVVISQPFCDWPKDHLGRSCSWATSLSCLCFEFTTAIKAGMSWKPCWSSWSPMASALQSACWLTAWASSGPVLEWFCFPASRRVSKERSAFAALKTATRGCSGQNEQFPRGLFVKRTRLGSGRASVDSSPTVSYERVVDELKLSTQMKLNVFNSLRF